MEEGGRTGVLVHDRRGWGRGGIAPPSPQENKKKEAVRGNFNLFHLCFTNEIKGGSIYYTCKMEGVGGQALLHGWRGWGARMLCPHPIKNKKRKGEYWTISVVGDK